MSKAVLKRFLPMAKALPGTNEFATQMSQVLTTQVLQFATFEQVPYLLLGTLDQARSQANAPDGPVCPLGWRETL